MLGVMTEMAYAKSLRGHPDTSTIFVLGLLGLLGGVVFAPCAWFFGNRLLDKYDAEPLRWGARGWVQAGVTMGKIGTFLIPVWLILIAFAS
jgi:hypothetical protein